MLLQDSPDPCGGDELDAQNPPYCFHWARIQVRTRNLPLRPDAVDRIGAAEQYLHIKILYIEIPVRASRSLRIGRLLQTHLMPDRMPEDRRTSDSLLYDAQ